MFIKIYKILSVNNSSYIYQKVHENNNTGFIHGNVN